ncbi:anticodon-binding aminoacyl-tRNA synthetase, class 1a [Tanacetum coccineum]
MHMGHLRSTFIGETLARMLEYSRVVLRQINIHLSLPLLDLTDFWRTLDEENVDWIVYATDVEQRDNFEFCITLKLAVELLARRGMADEWTAEDLEHAAEALGFGAVKFADLKNSRLTNYTFSNEEIRGFSHTHNCLSGDLQEPGGVWSLIGILSKQYVAGSRRLHLMFSLLNHHPRITYCMVNREKVTVTPHLGASTMEAQEGVVIEIVEAVDGALQGKLVATTFLSSLESKKKDGSDGDGEVYREGIKNSYTVAHDAIAAMRNATQAASRIQVDFVYFR